MGKKELSERIHRRLREEYVPRERSRGDPGDVLIRTVLSQNTSDVNSRRAFERLKSRFPGMEDIAGAETEDIEDAIRPGGLHKGKARVIKNLATWAVEEGLDLESMTDSEAREHLESMEGVGPKTASCVLLFALGREVLPVDTHVYRLSKRIGLLEESVPINRADRKLEEFVPPEIRYELHLNLIEHGRRVCRPRNPRCQECVIVDLCSYGRSRMGIE